jgi:hypothetical protein
MTRDEVVRLAREAGVIPELLHETGAYFQFVERFAALVAETARLEGWKSARERAAELEEQTICDIHLPAGVRIYGRRASDAIRAMQPPAEWGGAEMTNKPSETVYSKVDQLVLNSPTWPHEDGFAGGLTERSD